MFNDCTKAIEFGKSQMWDTFKWCMTLQFTFLGISLIKLIEFGIILSVIPLFIGAITFYIVYKHVEGLDKSRRNLEKVREKMRGVVLEIYPPDPKRIPSKKVFSNAYLIGIIVTSLGSSALILLGGIIKNAGT